MSRITTLLTRPSTLGVLAIAGSGAFFAGMKGRTVVAKQKAQAGFSEGAAGASEGAEGAIRGGSAGSENKNYEVNTHRSGGGV